MKTLIFAAIRCSLMFTAVTASLFSGRPAQAFTVTIDQVGSNVVANGSGAFNLTGLTINPNLIGTETGIGASIRFIMMGTPGVTPGLDNYFGLTGPTNFGSGGFFAPNIGSGDFVGTFILGPFSPREIPPGGTLGSILVPQGYVSGTALTDSMTFNSATFASLGVTPGTYVWSWGSGLPNQNFTLIIGTVPDGGSTVSLLGFGLLGLAALRRKLKLLKPIS